MRNTPDVTHMLGQVGTKILCPNPTPMFSLFLMVGAETKLDQCEQPNKRMKTQDYPLAQILHIACMQIIKSFCPDSLSQSESQPIRLRWFHFVWTKSSRHYAAAAASSSSSSFFFFVFK
jgi:hypothetical protein